MTYLSESSVFERTVKTRVQIHSGGARRGESMACFHEAVHPHGTRWGETHAFLRAERIEFVRRRGVPLKRERLASGRRNRERKDG